MKRAVMLTGAVVLVLFLTLTPQGQAREVSRVELNFFHDLGIKENVDLTEPYPSFSFHVPHYPGIDWRHSYLELVVLFPDTISPTNRLSVLVENTLVFSRSLGMLPIRPGELSYLRIPLGGFTPTNPQKPLLSIEVRGERSSSVSSLPEKQPDDLWMTISSQSSIFLFGSIRTSPPSVSHFFTWPVREIEVVLPEGEWPENVIVAAVELASSLRSSLKRWGTRVRLNSLAFMSDEEKADPDARRIYLREPAPRDYHLLGNRLFLSPRGAHLACLPERDTMVGSSGNVDALPPPPLQPSGKISLCQLSHDDLYLASWKKTTKEFIFPSSLLGGIPNNLEFHLRWRPLSLPTETLFLVSVNDHPVFSKNLLPAEEISSTLRYDLIHIPGNLLHGTNTLKFELHSTDGDPEALSGTTTSIFISADSLFHCRGTAPPPAILTFRSGGAYFWGRGTIVLPSQPSLNDIEAAAALFSTLPSGKGLPVDLLVISWDEFEKVIRETPGIMGSLIQRYVTRPSSVWSVFERLKKTPGAAREAYIQAKRDESGWEGEFRSILSAAGAFLYNYAEALGSFLSSRILGESSDMNIPFTPNFFLAVSPPDEHPFTISVERTTAQPVYPDEGMGILTTSWYRGYPVFAFSYHGPQDLALQYYLEAIDKNLDVRNSESNTVLFSREGSSAFTAVLPPTYTRPPTWQDDVTKYRGILILIGFALLVTVGIYFLSRLANSRLRGE